MRALVRSVIRTIRERQLVVAGDRLVVGVSGGADSVALTLLLREAADGLDVTLCGLVHVHHGLRGNEADRDAAFCADFARQTNLPIEIVHVDTRAAARARRISIEAAARELRYAEFSAVAARLGATRVATAHTLDDQAETVLLRLLRGAGGRGVSAIRPKRGMFVRPLIDCRRADLREFLRVRQHAFCHDSSNDDPAIPRNRLRRDLVPVIDQIAPGGVKALARFAALAADDEIYLEDRAIAAASAIVLSDGDGVQLDRDALQALPVALARRVVRWAAEEARARPLSARQIEAVRVLAASNREGARVDLPGLTVECLGGRIVFGRALPAMDNVDGAGPDGLGRIVEAPRRSTEVRDELVLEVPGSVTIHDAGVTILATVAAVSDQGGVELANGQGDRATVAADAICWPLSVRHRRPGDRFRPLGAPGRRKLQDVLVDRKWPRPMRDRVPIVVDAAGQIVWVVGVAVGHLVRVTTPGAKMVILEARRQK